MLENTSAIIVKALETLKIASKLNPEKVSEEYNILLLGEFRNQLDSIELLNFLKSKYDLDITIDELNAIIPHVCDSLNMKYIPVKNLNNAFNNLIDAYFIFLFQEESKPARY